MRRLRRVLYRTMLRQSVAGIKSNLDASSLAHCTARWHLSRYQYDIIVEIPADVGQRRLREGLIVRGENHRRHNAEGGSANFAKRIGVAT